MRTQLAALDRVTFPSPARRLHSGPTAAEQLTRRHPAPLDQAPMPAAVGPAPYRMTVAEIVGAAEADAIRRRGCLRFQCVGDTGGFHNPIPQRAVAAAMATELAGDRPVSFFYHLGDLVYLHGERAHYGAQFFDPYAVYEAPIVAIAGNHDGERPVGRREPALAGFAEQFCAAPDRVDTGRPRVAAHQPNVYWTLEHDWVTVIGLYSGVPEGGVIDPAQAAWLTGELAAARQGVTLILAMHHPVFSADTIHGSNLRLRDELDRCFADAARVPDAVFSAHAHNYQRYARTIGGREIPYVVAGSGGFHELHGLGHGVPELPASFASLAELTLVASQHREFGFMTISCGPAGARVDYSTVVRRRPVVYDSFELVPAAT